MPSPATGDAAADPRAFVVIVHPSNPTAAITRTELERIFRRSRRFWQHGGKIVPLNLPFGLPARIGFSRTVLRSTDAELVTFWNRQYFQGVLPPAVLHSVEAVLEFVAGTPTAIAYVPAGRENRGVRTVRVESDE